MYFFVGGAILGLSTNFLLWTFFANLATWFVPVGIIYVERANKISENYIPRVPSQFKCNDGFKEVKKEDKKTFLVDYDNLGLNYERKNMPVKNNIKVRKRTRNDF